MCRGFFALRTRSCGPFVLVVGSFLSTALLKCLPHIGAQINQTKSPPFLSFISLFLSFVFSAFICTNSHRKTPILHEMVTRTKSEKLGDFQFLALRATCAGGKKYRISASAYFLEFGPGAKLACGCAPSPRKIPAGSTGQIVREKFRPGLTGRVIAAGLHQIKHGLTNP